jgi:hypothetical protein
MVNDRRPAPVASPWAPLRSRIFLALFIAQLASNIGLAPRAPDAELETLVEDV